MINSHIKQSCLIVLAMLACLIGSAASWAFPQPGSQITNIATGDYQDDEGNVQVIDSNPVSLVIQTVYALDLKDNQQQIGTLGAKLNFPHTLTNTGNVSDTYSLSIPQQPSDDNFDLLGLAIYADRDQNGIPDDNVNLLNSTVQLEPGKSLALVVAGSIPTTVTPGNQAQFTLKATSVANASLSKSNLDTATVVDDAVILVTKSQSISQGSGAQDITYTLTYTNNGTAAGRVVMTDTLDTALTYTANSASWSNGSAQLTDADDTESAANTGIRYQQNGAVITIELASVPALTTGAVSFKARVNDPARERIANQATYSQYQTGSNNLLKNTKTNTVIYSTIFSRGVVANTVASAAVNDGNPDQAPHNLLIQPSINAGQEILFSNYIWNTGAATDSFNLTTTGNLPSCARVQLYTADGRTLLVDSNNDGMVDTGPLAAGSSRKITVGIYVSPGCSSSVPLYVDLTATSIIDTTKSDAVRNQITAVSASTTDLYNSDNSGLGMGVVDNNGAALLIKPLLQGQAIFPLEVKNSGSVANNYHLYAATSALSASNMANNLVDGWQVVFYEGDASCSMLGNQITNSGSVAPNAIKHYCAVVKAPKAGTSPLPAEQPIWFGVKSPINGQADVIMDQVNTRARGLILQNDQQGQVSTGGTINYLHTLKNIGTLTEGTAANQVTLMVSSQNPQDGFSYTLYHDANHNGKLDATDPIASDLATITSNAGLAPNQSLQLIVKVQAPATASNGTSSTGVLTVTPVGALQNLTADPVQNTDLTTVSSSQLRLVKSQVKAPCSTTQLENLSYDVVPLQVKPSECVAYQLKVTNEGSTSIANVVINDTVPAFTVLKNPPAPMATQGSVTIGSKGEIKATIGVLDSAKQAALYFLILVNQ